MPFVAPIAQPISQDCTASACHGTQRSSCGTVGLARHSAGAQKPHRPGESMLQCLARRAAAAMPNCCCSWCHGRGLHRAYTIAKAAMPNCCRSANIGTATSGMYWSPTCVCSKPDTMPVMRKQATCSFIDIASLHLMATPGMHKLPVAFNRQHVLQHRTAKGFFDTKQYSSAARKSAAHACMMSCIIAGQAWH